MVTCCFGFHSTNSYGPVPIGLVAKSSPRSSTAFFETTQPEKTGSVVAMIGEKGSLRMIVPEYVSSTLTSCSAGDQSPLYGESIAGCVRPAVRS